MAAFQGGKLVEYRSGAGAGQSAPRQTAPPLEWGRWAGLPSSGGRAAAVRHGSRRGRLPRAASMIRYRTSTGSRVRKSPSVSTIMIVSQTTPKQAAK